MDRVAESNEVAGAVATRRQLGNFMRYVLIESIVSINGQGPSCRNVVEAEIALAGKGVKGTMNDTRFRVSADDV